MKRPVLTAWSVVVVLLALLLPATVAAAKPFRDEGSFTYVSCDAATDDGFVSVFVEVNDSGDGFGDLAFWESPAEPFEDEPTLVPVAVDFSGGATGIDATFELVEFDPSSDPPFGDPAGTAVLDATFTPDGDPIPFEDDFRDGNVHGRVEGVTQPLTVAGTLTLPGADLTDLSGCFAIHEQSTSFATESGRLQRQVQRREPVLRLGRRGAPSSSSTATRIASTRSSTCGSPTRPRTVSGGTDVELVDGTFDFETPLFD